jgi:hypothetical protein
MVQADGHWLKLLHIQADTKRSSDDFLKVMWVLNTPSTSPSMLWLGREPVSARDAVVHAVDRRTQIAVLTRSPTSNTEAEDVVDTSISVAEVAV